MNNQFFHKVFSEKEKQLIHLLQELEAPAWLRHGVGQWLFSVHGMNYPESVLSREEEELLVRAHRLGVPQEFCSTLAEWLHQRHAELVRERLFAEGDHG